MTSGSVLAIGVAAPVTGVAATGVAALANGVAAAGLATGIADEGDELATEVGSAVAAGAVTTVLT